jgi:hypothetical protein
MREAHVRNTISKLSLFSRVATYGLLIGMFLLGGLRPDELRQLLFLISPITALYFAGLIKFMVDHRYQRKGDSLGNAFSMLTTWGLGGLYMGELLLVLLKSIANTLTYETIFTGIAIIEILLGAYAGFFITTLFQVKEPGN